MRYNLKENTVDKKYIKLIFFTALVLTFISWLMIDVANAAINTREALKKDYSSENLEQYLYKPKAGEFVLGKVRAPILMVDYSTFSCPHCVKFYNDVLPKIEKNYIKTGKVRFVHRDFPLSEQSLHGAMLTLCQKRTSGYFELLKEMYRTSFFWSYSSKYKEKLYDVASSKGISKNEVDLCWTNEEMKDSIQLNKLKSFKEFRISTTPTFFVNGRKIVGYRDYNQFKKIFDSILEE